MAMSLYKISYAETEFGAPAWTQRSYRDWLVDRWLEKNCKGPYYHGPGWQSTKSVEFELSEDAVKFALVWGR